MGRERRPSIVSVLSDCNDLYQVRVEGAVDHVVAGLQPVRATVLVVSVVCSAAFSRNGSVQRLFVMRVFNECERDLLPEVLPLLLADVLATLNQARTEPSSATDPSVFVLVDALGKHLDFVQVIDDGSSVAITPVCAMAPWVNKGSMGALRLLFPADADRAVSLLNEFKAQL